MTPRDQARIFRLALFFFVPLVAIIGVVAAGLFLVRTSSESAALKDIEWQVVENLRAHLRHDLDYVASDLLYLAHREDMDKIFLADGTTSPAIEEELLKDLLHICATKGIYDQIRILDSSGREVMRVNYHNGRPAVVPSEELQPKGHRYYFRDAMALQRGEIYVSPLDLNMEHGAIEQPPKPMIRFATPVFDGLGNKRGIIIVNYLAEQLLSSFHHSPHSRITRLMLLNRDGYWLKGLHPEDEWGFMYPQRRSKTFGALYPDIWHRINSTTDGQLITPAGLFTFATVAPLNSNMRTSSGSHRPDTDGAALLPPGQYFWKIVSLAPRAALDYERQVWLRRGGIILGVITLLLAFVSWRLAFARHLRMHTESSLYMRERYLHALNRGAATLVSSYGEISFQPFIDCIGPVSEASRAYLFLSEENNDQGGEELRLAAQWRPEASGQHPDGPTREEHPLSDCFRLWAERLARGETIAGSAADFPAEERALLEAQGIRTILVLPLIVEHRLYGLMGFDNCLADSSWQEAEADFLHNAASHLTQVIKQRRNETALLRAKDEWERTFDSVPDSIAIIDQKYRIVRVNKALARQVGLPPWECIGKTCHILIHAADVPITECPHHQLLRDGNPHSVELYDAKRGSHFHITVSPIHNRNGELLGSVHVARDITKRKKAENALRETHQRLLTVLDSLAALVYVIDINNFEILFLNRYAKEIFGDVTGKTCWQTIQTGMTGPCDFCPNEILRQAGTESEKPHIWEAFNTINSRWYENRDKAITWLDGRLVKIQIGTDITDRRQTREALQASEEQLRTLIDSTPDIVCFKDGEGRWLEANRADLELFRLTGVDYHHKKDRELAGHTHPLYRQAFLACEDSDEKAWSAGRAVQSEEIIPTVEDGQRIYDIIKVPLFHGDGRRKGLVVLGRDITERKKAEEKLREYAVTQEVLLREVNHRVKNNLAAIISMLHKEEDRAKSDGMTDSLSLLHDLEGRIRGLSTVHSLLTEHAWRPLPLAELCERVAQAAVHTVSFAQTVDLKVTESPVKVRSSQAHHLALVINELATNSVKHGARQEATTKIRIEITEEEGTVELCFRDNGPGFPDQILAGDHSRANIGFDLINGIVRRSLRGTISLANDHGAVTTLSFRNETTADNGD